jgi:TonB-dependent receptor
MPKHQFYKTKIAAGLSLAIGATLPVAPAFAQEEQVLEEVVVTGIRSSLKKAMDTKRDSIGVVDAITAEDMGKFPDTNLAESLQRITGVSIDRSRGEGSKITVRGFGSEFNLVTLNGRQMPTHSGRSFEFADIASEGVSSVEVYKTGRASVATGGIGASINIKTPKPLDDPGVKASFGVKGVNDTSTATGASMTPELSGIFSNTFFDDTVGVAITASHQERNNGQASSSNTEWKEFTPAQITNDISSNIPAEGAIVGLPQQIIYNLDEWERVRTNGHLVLQWAPSETLTGTLDYTYAKHELDHRYTGMSAWFSAAGQAVNYSDPDGNVVSPLTYNENNRDPDIPMASGFDSTVNVVKSIGVNLDWAVSDNFSVAVDYHESQAKRDPNSPFGSSANLSIASFERVGATVDYTGDIPVLTIASSDPLSPDDMMITGSTFANSWAQMDIDQLQVDATYEFNDNARIDFGLSLTDVQNFESGSNIQRNTWSKSQATAYGAISDLLTPVSLAGQFDQFASGSLINNNFFTFDMQEMINRAEFLQNLPESNPMHLATALAAGDCGTGFCADSDPGFGSQFLEESQAFYVNFVASGEIYGMPANFNFGARYEATDVTSSAESLDFTSIVWSSANEFVSQIAPESVASGLQGDYSFLLPSLDFDVELTDDVKLRGAYSKTIARPSFGNINGTLRADEVTRATAGVLTGRASVGNPGLLPHESDNFDLSLEWYYGETSYMSVGWFSKEVVNFVTAGTVEDVELFPGLAHPALGPLYEAAYNALNTDPNVPPSNTALRDYIFANFADEPGVDAVAGTITGVAGRDGDVYYDVSTLTNSEDVAKVDGFEIAVQHDFGESGFGVIANATLVDGNAKFNRFIRASQFHVPGLSDTYNVIGYYDKHGVQVRIAYNWRDTFLVGASDKPSYVKEYGQWDLSASYELTENLTVSLEGINLTNETYKTYGRSELQFYNVGQSGPRYNVAARYTF